MRGCLPIRQVISASRLVFSTYREPPLHVPNEAPDSIIRVIHE